MQFKIIKSTINREEIKKVLDTCGSGTRVYFGSDSKRRTFKGRVFIDYDVVVIIHKNGKNGCKVFGETARSFEDLDKYNLNKPINRMIGETERVVDVYKRLEDIFDEYILKIDDFDISIQLDINPNESFGSSCAISSAMGYVKATTNILPIVKPDALAASYGADRWREVSSQETIKKASNSYSHFSKGRKLKRK